MNKQAIIDVIKDANLGMQGIPETRYKQMLIDIVNATNSLSASAALNFPATAAQTSSDLTIAVVGAALGQTVKLGVPFAAVNANSSFTAFVSAADVVTVRLNNYSSGSIDPASGTFKVVVE